MDKRNSNLLKENYLNFLLLHKKIIYIYNIYKGQPRQRRELCYSNIYVPKEKKSTDIKC